MSPVGLLICVEFCQDIKYMRVADIYCMQRSRWSGELSCHLPHLRFFCGHLGGHVWVGGWAWDSRLSSFGRILIQMIEFATYPAIF